MKRIQFLMDDDFVRELDKLVEKNGLKTRTQLLNVALTLYDWAVRERESGNIIASVNERTERYKEIELPGFPAPNRGLDDASNEELVKELKNRIEKTVQDPAVPGLLDRLAQLARVSEGSERHPEYVEAKSSRSHSGRVYVTPPRRDRD
jgi:hypothetical protein